MILNYKERPSLVYAALVCGVGAAALAASVVASPLPISDARYLLLAFCALTAGTLLYFKVPRAGAVVPFASAFVFAAAISGGGGAAVPLAVAVALVSALRFAREGRSVLCDSALAAAAAFCSVEALLWFYRASAFGPSLSAALGVAACSLAQAAVESVPVSVYGPGAGGRFSARLYLKSFVWGALTYTIPSSAAVLLARLPRVNNLDSLPALAAVSAGYALLRAYKSRTTSPQAIVGTKAAGVAAAADRPTLEDVFDHAAIGMAVLSSRGKLLRVNRSLCNFFGYSESELVCSSLQAVTQQEDLAPVMAGLKSVLRRHSDSLQMEVRHKRRGGERVWALWNVARFEDSESEEVYLILQLQDITERKQSEERLRYDAFHDPLTGLPNRALFTDHVKLTIARAQRHEDTRFSVLFCDLDRFKVINDSLGHMVGDQLLVEVARRLEGCLRQGDTVARVGGDEFTILVEDLTDEGEAVALAERIQREVSAAFNVGGREVFTTVSIGVAVGSGGYKDPEDILRDADTAMYRAKSLGKARHVVFDQSMHASAVNLLQIETDLRAALEKKQFFLLYQPIVSLDDFKLCGFEALLRWHHPERGLISPLDFVSIAEETGQIIAVGEWALHQACKQLRRWEREYGLPSPFFISVNLSCKQFNNPLMLEQVRGVLEKTGISPRQLKLEITESAVMDNMDSATEMLTQLRDLGVQLAIDDFGTGYSSLSYLHRFPINTLKIDRSFVTRMAENTENVEIVRSIVMLAQVLGMDVVAEGVETKEQLKILRDLKCEYGQGYYFSRPSNAADAEKIIIETDERLVKTHKRERGPELPELSASDDQPSFLPVTSLAEPPVKEAQLVEQPPPAEEAMPSPMEEATQPSPAEGLMPSPQAEELMPALPASSAKTATMVLPSFPAEETMLESPVKTLAPLDEEEEEFLEALILLEEAHPASVKMISPFSED
jgi:diguanylate cyclase (GGDEF)-like protein/PAS domain S-box-containing protein